MTTTDGRRHAPLDDLTATAIRDLTATDESFHDPASGSQHWTETSWWAFTVPSTGGGGWIYLQARPRIGMIGLGVWVWDQTSIYPYESPYSRQYHHVELPADADYTHLTLPDYGFELECLEPFAKHRIRYTDRAQIDLDLTFRAAVPPRPLGVNDRTGHLDQALWASGTITVGGQTIEVDGAAFRDRTWSDRFDNGDDPRKNCYVWGVTEDGSTMLHVLSLYDSEGRAPAHFGGTVGIGGELSGVTNFTRRCTRRSPDGNPLDIELELTDSDGRTRIIPGTSESCNAIAAFPGYLSYASIVRWQLDGRELWGEDHETWPYAALWATRDGDADIDRWQRPYTA